MDWISTDSELPDGEVLVWVGGRFHIAVIKLIARNGEPIHQFEDARSGEIIEWPEYWMALPPFEGP